VIYALLIDDIVRPRPMRPEVTKIGAHCVAVTVDEVSRQVELVKRRVPELLHRFEFEYALPYAW
jgi:hypothetical protein